MNPSPPHQQLNGASKREELTPDLIDSMSGRHFDVVFAEVVLGWKR